MDTLRGRILSASDISREEMTIAEWDGVTIRVHCMTAAQRADMAKSVGRDTGIASVRALIACTSDPTTGLPLFEPADQDALLKKHGGVVDRILAVIMRLSGLTKDAEEALEKN